MEEQQPSVPNEPALDKFASYYAAASLTQKSVARFEAIRDLTLRCYRRYGANRAQTLDIADIGCGAGTLSRILARANVRVHGLDINEQLLNLARQRAIAEGLDIDFRIGSAVSLPWDDATMDICLLPELIEHVADWRSCVRECARLLRPGGLLYLTTTNGLCPKQQEFDLPFYSWYPAPLKRYYEKLAVSTRPELVQYTQYPAVHWFTYYQLRDDLWELGFSTCLDRFDTMDSSGKSIIVKGLLSSIRAVPLLRWLAHVATSNLRIIAIKSSAELPPKFRLPRVA